eukprot:CAMPEP_0172634166 /NCGR_PEP_ID=MMETSP1068-20121228/193181_1 /TAXON_ID=35684 /ORGANISM="Pseudopedinella elastica, Strain CCMP716" /LENGTH=124 /DNA_ID=CAMNT_0013446045 /DNA_START=26 /DNA_END=397 /DNA_ORIENTATION=+
MHPGSFGEARQEAKLSGRWLLVNIQAESEFDSHRLNRDTWPNETLQLLLESLCVFWQQYEASGEGELFCSRYRVSKYPHLAMIHPRTGLCLWEKAGFVSAEFLCDKVSDFCGRHSLDDDDDDCD